MSASDMSSAADAAQPVQQAPSIPTQHAQGTANAPSYALSSTSNSQGPSRPLVPGSSAVARLGTSSSSVGGRGLKRRSDGTVKERAKKLGIGFPTLYDWRKHFSNPIHLNPSSALAAEIRTIAARTAEQNLASFLNADDQPSVSSSSSIIDVAVAQITSNPASSTAPLPSFNRPDGLGPSAEPESTFGAWGPGVLPPELVEQLEQAGALAIDEEVDDVHATSVEADTHEGVAQFVNETLDLTLHLQQSTLAPSTKASWDRCKRHFLVFWRCLSRIRAQQHRPADAADESGSGSGGSSSSTDPAANGSSGGGRRRVDALEEILVSEQKLVTYLK
ncbi:unnamed protein product [Tilletia controversa]|nr:unnamed protein product [Tilletia controversa]